MDSKILMVGWGYPPEIDGGLDIHVKHLFEELRQSNVQVDLVLPSERAPDKENIISVDTGDGDMIQKSRFMSKEVAQIAEEYDIIHTHDWFGAESGYKSKKYSDTDWVATFHSLSKSRNRNPGEEVSRLEEVAVEESDKLIAVSNKLADEIEEEHGRRPNVIHNGFSKTSNSDLNVKKRHNIDSKVVFYVGRHAEQKGLEHLIYGFKLLVEEEDAVLIIGGKGDTTDRLKDFVSILGIEENVVFTGFIPNEELGDYYKASDVFVSPSINEPFGLTITEALESGTNVVATDSGVDELAGDSIVSVEPKSESIKEGILQALNQDDFSEIDGWRSWEDMAKETIEIYKKLS